MDAWHRNGVASQLREIRLPVLIATGTEDIVIPASNAMKLVNAITGAWLAQFPHGGHAFVAQYPRALADLINSFLAVEWWCLDRGYGWPPRTRRPSADLSCGSHRFCRFSFWNQRPPDARYE